MINKSKQNIPELRFKGFTNAWEQCDLLQVAKYRNGKAHENEIDENGQYIVVNSKFVSTDGEIKKFTNKMIEPLNENEIAFVLSDVPNGKAIARTFLVKYNDKYSLNQRIAGITPYEYTHPYFLSILMNRNKYFLSFDDGAKQTNLSKNDVEKFESLYPIFKEQCKIGALFENIDNLITLHQRKYDKLVNVKKSLLEQMFPQKNEKTPKIRFKGFTDAWEQCEFRNIFEYERPDGYIVESDKYLNQYDTPVLTANKGFILGYTNETRTYNTPCIIFDDFTMDSKLVDFPFMVKSSAIKILSTKSCFDLRFSYELLDAAKIENLGHARHYISVVQPAEVFVPKYEEQTKIGNLFENIDNLITLHQRKYDKLVNVKKSLLDKMFI